MADEEVTGQKGTISGTIKGRGVPESRANVVADPNNIDEIYADGVAGMSMRNGVVKLDCYRVVGQQAGEGDQPREVRRVTHRMVLPAASLAELAQVLQRAQDLFRKSATEGEAEQSDIITTE